MSSVTKDRTDMGAYRLILYSKRAAGYNEVSEYSLFTLFTWLSLAEDDM